MKRQLSGDPACVGLQSGAALSQPRALRGPRWLAASGPSGGSRLASVLYRPQPQPRHSRLGQPSGDIQIRFGQVLASAFYLTCISRGLVTQFD